MQSSNRTFFVAFQGFTLIELSITLAIVGVLVALVVPNVRDFSLSSKLTNYANDFIASVALARSEAIKRNLPVTLCAASCASTASTCSCANSGGWEQGWVMLWDSQSDGNLGDDASDLLTRHASLDTGLRFTETNNLRRLTFQPSGVGSTQASLTLCQDTPSDGIKEKIVTVSATGRTSISTTHNGSCP